MKVVLASQSKFRIQILKQVGVDFDSHAATINEKDYFGSSPLETAELRSSKKAHSVLDSQTEDTIIIGCDQTLEFEARLYDKAQTLEEARKRLLAFQGKTHLLHSSTTLLAKMGDGDSELTFTETCSMNMRSLAEEQIDKYLALGEWRGCVGCYQFENVGANLFNTVEGDTQSIVGLPVLRLLKELRNLGYHPL